LNIILERTVDILRSYVLPRFYNRIKPIIPKKKLRKKKEKEDKESIPDQLQLLYF